ncbi:MAG: ribose transport system substrate-binding protein [Frankiales bacterium]|nr:ribose transport system substrate-binding protein [Frankiales bacterium]
MRVKQGKHGLQISALGAAACLLAAGCGSSSKSAGTGGGATSAATTATTAATATTGAPTATTGATTTAASTPPAAGGGGLIGVDYPRSDSDFWNAYIKYVPEMASTLKATIKTTSSGNDITKLNANADTLVAQGAKALVLAPQDTAGIIPELAKLAAKKIPVVTIDTEPDSGKVFMIVRADNKAYGTKSCKFIGDTLKGVGNVVEFEGDLASVNGRDRSTAFGACMKANYPNMKVFAEPTKWDTPTAIGQLNSVLAGNKIQAIYMQASIYLSATIADLKSKGLLKPAGTAGHIVMVSNDGVNAEFKAIQAGQLDATIDQPADLYAKYGLFYAQQALAGKTFSTGPTDHKSNIVTAADGNLEDQLPAALVTVDGAYPGSLKSTDSSLWGNQSG